jgi:hypothetical protein
MSFECQYCNRKYAKESTLTNHSCEPKRRYQQENEIGVQWALQAYKIFYETTQSGRQRDYQDFVNSSYYTAFVKYGRYCHSIHCINLAAYTRWLLRNNRKLDRWTSDQFYTEWLLEYLRKENVRDAMTRSIETMSKYAQQHPELRNGYRDYFRLVNENRICYHISTGRISAWVVYHCDSGVDFLNRLNTDQVATVIDFIDPAYWQKCFRDLAEDTEFARHILEAAGL